MWKARETDRKKERIKFTLLHSSDGSRLSMHEVLRLLKEDEDFRSFYSSYLANFPFKAFFWEHPPLFAGREEEAYECCLVNAPALEKVKPDLQTFDDYFKEDKPVVSFPNLGGDARLVVPCPDHQAGAYPHIAAFIRKAKEEQLHAFWKQTAEETLRSIGNQPVWLSTSGLGVYWVHVRIDTTPKYYQTREYKNVGA